jgi:hypothetical protein
MDEPRRPTDPTPHGADQWAFPGDLSSHDPLADESDVQSTLLRDLAPDEAERWRAILEAEGIACTLRIGAGDDASADAQSPVQILVFQDDLAVAEHLIEHSSTQAGNGNEAAEEDVEPPNEREARLLRDWLCLQCGTHTLELLPLRRWQKWRLRLLGIIFLGPFVIELLAWLLLIDLPEVGEQTQNRLVLGWLAVLAVLLFSVVSLDRHVRCNQCKREFVRQ